MVNKYYMHKFFFCNKAMYAQFVEGVGLATCTCMYSCTNHNTISLHDILQWTIMQKSKTSPFGKWCKKYAYVKIGY